MNCISATGRWPWSAAPTAAPTMSDSAMGVSTTRSGPNSSSKPAVTLKAPPSVAMSSPRQKTLSSRSISSRSASWIAWTYVTSAMGQTFPSRVIQNERGSASPDGVGEEVVGAASPRAY